MAAARLRLRAALAYFGVFLLGYMLVAVGRPAALAMKAAGEAALVRARSAVAPGSGGTDVSQLSTAELEAILAARKGSVAAQPAAARTAPAASQEPRTARKEGKGAAAMVGIEAPVAAVGVAAAPAVAASAPAAPVAVDADNIAARLFPPGAAPAVNPADHKLTQERVEALARGNVLMVTWANYHYLDFVINWVYHINKLGVTNYLVGSMDDDILKELVHRGVNTFSMRSGLSTSDFGWGSPTFHKMGREKINLIVTFTNMGIDLLLSDVDTVWMRDPMPYIARYPDADVLTSSDHLSTTVGGEELEKWPNAASAANIGIMFFRARTPGARELAKEWSRLLDKNPNYWDQNAFNDLFRAGPHDQAGKNLFKAFRNKINLGILPTSIFASGHTFFVQAMAEKLHMTPYVVHATFQFSGTPGKRHRFREKLMWLDPLEYFDRPGGFLSFDLDLPREMLGRAGPSPSSMNVKGTVGHFALANHQILQVRNGIAISLALGRALVMPELWCGLDRWWAPHSGVIPGSHFQLPFPCPMDHIFDLEQMVREVPHLGPRFEWREHSFLQNPRLPKALNESRIVVEFCAEGQVAGCADGSAPAQEQSGRVRLRSGLTDRQLQTALEPFRSRKFIHMASLTGNAFGGHADPGEADKFKHRTMPYTSLWCCANAHPGHVWYDMWFDKVPRRDRHNKEWTTVWEPRTGP